MIPLGLDEIHFGTPWAAGFVLLALLLPVFSLLLREWKQTHRPEAEFVSPEMRKALLDDEIRSARYQKTASFCFWLCALLLSVALTRPQWGVLEETIHQRGLDVVIAVDLSQSMEASDLNPTRIENARRELAFLAEELQGNRIGLVGFAGSAFLFCPLTLDTDAVEMFLSEMTTRAIPVPGTALGDAIRLGLETFEMSGESGDGSKVLLILTDGEDHQSRPLEAAEEAAQKGVVIDTVGIGTAEGAIVPSQYGGVLKDQRGEPVVSKLAGDTLKQLSEKTGGHFMRLDGTGGGLGQYLKELQKRETRSFGDTREIRRHERFPYFLAAAALFFLLALVFQELDKRR